MQYEINSGGINVIFETVDLTAVVGDAARIDVGEALNYIKTGQAEVQEVVDSGTAAFNLNAQQKTIAFNNNATEKTGDFNANATSKTNAFNSNATNKTGDFNDNYTAKKALIDAEVGNAAASATTASGYADTAKQWAIGDPSEPTGNSAKYWADTAAATLSGKQDTLVSGTNIKTINNESLLGSGNITIQGGGSSYTAGTGIDITNNKISVTSPTLTNTATGSNAYSVGGTATSTLSCSFGYNAIASGARSTVIGEQANAAGQYATAIGAAASAEGDYAIQLGYGRNSSSNTLSVGFRTSNSLLAKNWQLLDGTTGYIPNARINMDSTPTSASTNTVTSGGVYTALSGKADTSSLATVATSGSYNDLSDKPSSRNIGEVITSTIPLSDAGLHLLDGSLIQSGVYTDFVDYIAGFVSDYPDLFVSENDWQTAVTTYGVCGKFVYDSTNNTVRLPKITGFIEGTTDVTALGDLVEAGLPNIKASLNNYQNKTGINASSNSALYFGSSSNTLPLGASSSGFTGLYFDASRSNSIYGNSSTVQPQAIKVLYYIVMATSTKTDVEVDIDEIITDLNSKANTNLSNISNTATKSIDGQWVYNYQLLANNVAADNTTPVTQYSLANYLPNDGYDYEVLMQGICNTGTTSGQFMSIVLRTDIYTGSIEICSNRTRTNSLVDTRGNGILVVGTGRYVSHIPSNSGNYNGNYTLAATAYRRIGTNS